MAFGLSLRGADPQKLVGPVLGASAVGFAESHFVRPMGAKVLSPLFTGSSIMGRLGPVATTFLTTEAGAALVDKVSRSAADDVRLGGHILAGYRLVSAISPATFPEFGALALPGHTSAQQGKVAAGATAGAAAGALAGPAGAAIGAAAGAAAAASGASSPSPYATPHI